MEESIDLSSDGEESQKANTLQETRPTSCNSSHSKDPEQINKELTISIGQENKDESQTSYVIKITNNTNKNFLERIETQSVNITEDSTASMQNQFEVPRSKLGDPRLKTLVDCLLKIEFSTGMLRIINQVLMPKFKAAEKEYVQSQAFLSTLQETSSKLALDPGHRYTHLKELTDALSRNKRRKKQKIINVDSYEPNVKVRRKRKKPMPSLLSLQHPVQNKNNVANTEDIVMVEDQPIILDDDIIDKNLKKVKAETIVITDSFDLLDVPPALKRRYERILKELEVTKSTGPVRKLEAYMKTYMQAVWREETELVTDGAYSSYLITSSYMERVLETFNKICHLTESSSEDDSVLNFHKNVFPQLVSAPLIRILKRKHQTDFVHYQDVLNIVGKLYSKKSLEWQRDSAIKIFRLCGKALKKRRQRREWEQLVESVGEDFDDPADHDEELRAELDRNRVIAEKNMTELFYRLRGKVEEKYPENKSELNDLHSSIAASITDVDETPKDDKKVDSSQKVCSKEKIISKLSIIENAIRELFALDIAKRSRYTLPELNKLEKSHTGNYTDNPDLLSINIDDETTDIDKVIFKDYEEYEYEEPTEPLDLMIVSSSDDDDMLEKTKNGKVKAVGGDKLEKTKVNDDVRVLSNNDNELEKTTKVNSDSRTNVTDVDDELITLKSFETNDTQVTITMLDESDDSC